MECPKHEKFKLAVTVQLKRHEGKSHHKVSEAFGDCINSRPDARS